MATIRPEEDDGVMNTHFAYEWSPQSRRAPMSVALGNLPEMHVWVGFVDRQEIVDFSTRHLKVAPRDLGMAWLAADPPQYLWCRADALEPDILPDCYLHQVL